MSKRIEVAVAILQRPSGEYLLASRPHGKGWAGWWEFPGGKLEAGESAQAALIREAQEELGITPTRMQAWMQRSYDYPATHDAEAKTVRLHFFLVWEWSGELQPLEGQQLTWQAPNQPAVSPVLPANAPILHALSLPAIYAISQLATLGHTRFIQALKHQLDHGLKLLQIREAQLSATELTALSDEVLSLCAPYACRCLLNGEPTLASALGYQGVQLNRHRLMTLLEKPAHLLVGSSCHTLAELQRAQQLQLDFALLSPVLPTRSHPEATPMGWETFAHMIEGLEIPVYALGGMHSKYLPNALASGGRGIAMLSGAWSSV